MALQISTFDLIAGLLVLTALFGWINQRLIGMPQTIGLLVVGLCASLMMIAADLLFPHTPLYESLAQVVRRIDFQETVLNGMLAFLLFAGALHVDLSLLRRRALVVGTMATLGVILSTVIVGVGLWLLANAMSLPLPLSWAMVFGALISPTDPVAVLSTLKAVKVPAELEIDMSGESLFNDGIGVVVFTVALALAVGSADGEAIGAREVAELFFVDALGGGLLGLATGYLAYRAMRAIDDYPIEVLVSLALVAGTYALASHLHLSGPIAMVVAGLLIGNKGPVDAMSDQTQRYLFGFWTLADEVLNAVLFLLIGLEALVLRFELGFVWLAIATVPLTLLARYLSVQVPVAALSFHEKFSPGTVAVLTWGGLRGGISIALALSLPEVAEKSAIVILTYAVVLFTIIVQGLSLRTVVERLVPRESVT